MQAIINIWHSFVQKKATVFVFYIYERSHQINISSINNLRCWLDLLMMFSRKVFCGATSPLRPPGIATYFHSPETLRHLSKSLLSVTNCIWNVSSSWIYVAYHLQHPHQKQHVFNPLRKLTKRVLRTNLEARQTSEFLSQGVLFNGRSCMFRPNYTWGVDVTPFWHGGASRTGLLAKRKIEAMRAPTSATTVLFQTT